MTYEKLNIKGCKYPERIECIYLSLYTIPI